MAIDSITVKGAREHNLKDIDLEIPRDNFIVITGLSGSGKSTLAFDTIYAEGQRRYVESLSTYARRFLERIEKPDVDSIEGLSPSISIDQRTIVKSPRSTVGTVTEIYDYLRLLFSRLGRPYCYSCGKEITSQTAEQMVERILALPVHSGVIIFSPIVRGRKGEYKKEIERLRQEGFLRVRIDGMMRELDEDIVLDRNKHHNIDLVVDRIKLRPFALKRLAESVDAAARLSSGLVLVECYEGGGFCGEPYESLLFNESLSCVDCGVSYPDVTPRFFSFNSPYGACPSCKGLGIVRYAHDTDSALGDDTDSEFSHPCSECGGKRLRKEALHIRLNGFSIGDLSALSLKKLTNFIDGFELRGVEEIIGRGILKEISERLGFIKEVGLDYLTLDRAFSTLSGGEASRVRLATQIGSELSGILYVLDEPTIGLHQRDNLRLIGALKRLKSLGNTVVVVEHDEETIRNADFIVDMGPGAGESGGRIVVSGEMSQVLQNRNSLTAKYLNGELSIPLPSRRRRINKKFVILEGASENNLKDLTVRFPLGVFTCVTGVSGSGKSSLVIDTLYKALASILHRSKDATGRFRRLKGLQHIDRVIDVDQSPIGRTPRSNPATYCGLFTPIRVLFSQLTEARVRGYCPGRFSFNVKGGRCEECRGVGLIRVEMHFLPDVYVLCERCNGKRYNPETLNIRYKGKTIADVLDMTVAEALKFFENIPDVKRKLDILDEVGLGYLRLGQQAVTLSGGEAQRLKLSTELSRRSTGRTLYILDEPTTGLHFQDIGRLLSLLHRLVDAGNTVIVIEHNLDVIKSADYIIELGPEGGDKGGDIVVSGSPEEIVGDKASHTAVFLRDKLAVFEKE